MSFAGEHYFRTDDSVDLDYLIGVLTAARNNGQGVRILTEGGKLKVARGGGCWTPPMVGTFCHQRDVRLPWQALPR